MIVPRDFILIYTRNDRRKHRLTPELHVGHNDLLTDAGEDILVLKQMLVVRPFAD